MEMVDGYVAGIEAIDGLKMHAKPDLTIINFGSDEVDIFRVAEVMAESGWVPPHDATAKSTERDAVDVARPSAGRLSGGPAKAVEKTSLSDEKSTISATY